jgi:IS30 family transposase
LNQNEISKQLSISQSTISREFSHNTGQRRYHIKQAQMSSDNRRLTARKSIKMTPSLIELIDSKITEKWSPEQIYGRLKKEQNIYISYAGRNHEAPCPVRT